MDPWGGGCDQSSQCPGFLICKVSLMVTCLGAVMRRNEWKHFRCSAWCPAHGQHCEWGCHWALATEQLTCILFEPLNNSAG